ncbi:cytochrome b/b6 domain-containing protein [Xinfangfangia sp. CPCC 101601]|uniref:Cytochrome b/b6 domain-containing protein n=1 Tax=Pseudogemmobacter lacusdianii TaxID=3069608 RepID=A0ABU0W140_9RHOB|nr:cytochrome b/b6 domain-containing protein [Xinfangfangia sp. CPCC 101601]MDQ2067713.1 cytochrome b/b6 domain-containing protein [Xinfangfangia sp. CPCC 101601]
MPPHLPPNARNSAVSYGRTARLLHWLTALLMLITFPLGLIANALPYDSSEALALKAQVFSVHKTLGVTLFFVALIRILWALSGEKPRPLHPERRVESFLAELVHWALYLALVLVPLSGWAHHAASTGFAPILWPFGQDLPLIAKSPELAKSLGHAHVIFTKLLLGALVLHIAGVVKHVLIDRDATLARMSKGVAAGDENTPHSRLPNLMAGLLAAAIFAAAASAVVAPRPAPLEGAAETPTASAPLAATEGPVWQVSEGSLTFTVQQMGAAVTGQLPAWQAQIAFDPDLGTGTVSVGIDTTALTLGSVTEQAKAPDFFDSATHPQAIFEGDIAANEGSYIATGTLTLRGVTVPVNLPFTLQIEGNQAEMTGQVTLDRRDFGMGESYSDESSVGFGVEVAIKLTAQRQS